MFLSKDDFYKYKNSRYNLVPLCLELMADLDTPLSIYLKLVGLNRKNSFLLESVIGGERFGRYSYIGLSSNTYIQSEDFNGKTITSLHENDNIIKSLEGNALDNIKTLQQNFNPLILDNMPRFCGGWAGYFGYETVHHIEKSVGKIKVNANDDLCLPNIKLLLCNELAVIDNLQGKLLLIKYINPNIENSYETAVQRLQDIKNKLNQNIASQGINNNLKQLNDENNDIKYMSSEADYINIVNQAKEYIKNGDIMQVVLSQRMQKKFTGDSISLYRALRQLNPSPYMYYYCFGDTQIVGSSPELLVRHEIMDNKNLVTVRPLAGTRPRGANIEEDEKLAKDLLLDEKETAEHTMLIDLARNDIGRLAKTGTIKLTQNMAVEKYSHVQHIVSSVQGEINNNIHNLDILKAVFPAGTLSGAAKVRAMQVINELETMPRHIYGGGVGYISFNGEMDIAIAIRTAVIQNKTAYIQAGAGIVYDSIAKNEWIETQNKAKAILKAIENVENI